MAIIQLFTESAHEGLMSYRTTPFDIASAITDESVQISEDLCGETGFPHGDETYHAYRIVLTSNGVRDHMDSYPASPEQTQFPINNYSISEYTPGDANCIWTKIHNGSLQPPAPKPSDYDLHYRDKYWVSYEVNSQTPYFENASATWDSSKDYYTAPTQQGWLFWCGNDNFFGVSHFWSGSYIYGVGEYQGENFGFFRNSNGVDLFPRINGIGGQRIIDPNTTYMPACSEAWSPARSTADSKMGAFFIDCVYNGESMAGIIAIVYNDDSTVARAEGFIISSGFFAMDYNRYYAPPEATPEFGFGAHALPGRNVNQGPERYVYGNTYDLGLSGAGSAPGSIGLKLVCSTMPVLNAYLGQYISDATPTTPGASWFVDAAQILGNINSSVVDVFKLPFGTASQGTAMNQFQIGGDTMTGGPMYYQFPQQEVIDCGAITLPEEEGSYLDYAPYTKISIYIPFCGEFDLPTNSIMGGSIELYYLCDRLTGGCMAYVFSYDRNGREKLLGVFNGNMKLSVPLSTSAANLQPLANAVSTMAKTAMTVAGMAGFANRLGSPAFNPPAPAQSLHQTIGDKIPANFFNPMSSAAAPIGSADLTLGSKIGGAVSGALGYGLAAAPYVGAGIVGAGIGATIAGKAAGELGTAPVQLETIVGALGANAGWAGPAIPFIRIVKTVCKEPRLYLKDTGKPSNVSNQVSEIESGKIIQLDNFCLDGLTGTQKEKEVIYKILTSGFYK